MKITYNKNPLFTHIELNENEKKELWYKIKIKEMEELMSNASFYLQEGQYFHLDKAKKEIDPDYFLSDNNKSSQLDKRCDQLLSNFIEELQSSHSGDCVCLPCSCGKCYAESLLGINTLPGLGTHEAHTINAVFNNNEVTLDQAIEHLSQFHINPDNFNTENWKKLGGYEQYIPRWKAEQERAHAWLLHYKNEHFKTTI